MNFVEVLKRLGGHVLGARGRRRRKGPERQFECTPRSPVLAYSGRQYRNKTSRLEKYITPAEAGSYNYREGFGRSISYITHEALSEKAL